MQQLCTLAVLFMLAVGLTGTLGAPAAVWHRRFQVDFTETTKLLWSWQTTGKMYYDAEQNVELVTRANGQGDRYCMSIHPFTNTPCSHLVVGGQRYLLFPGLEECCRCCGKESGCGIISPNWLDAAEYKGQTTIQGRLADAWSVYGLQPNEYYATADEQAVPLQLNQIPNDYIAFHSDTFSTQALPPATFDAPDGCNRRCPLTSVCTLLKLRGLIKQSTARRLKLGARKQVVATA